jgi:hypothetical protein
MNPLLIQSNFLFRDIVWYSKYLLPKEKLRGKIVAVRDPYNSSNIVFRRVIADENQWV